MTSIPPRADSDLSDSGPESPVSPSPLSSPADSPSASSDEHNIPLHRPQVTGHSLSTSGMTPSSTPLGNVNAARRPGPPQATLSGRGGSLPPEMEARMKAFHLGRQGAPPAGNPRSGQAMSQTPIGSVPTPSSPKLGPGGVPSNFRVPPGVARPPGPQFNSSPVLTRGPTNKPSLAQKRGMALPGGLSDTQSGQSSKGPKARPGLTLSQMNGASSQDQRDSQGSSVQTNGGGSLLDKYADFIDAKSGSLRFKGKATLTNQGVEFSGGSTFSISLDEVDTLDELGKGNYGTVYKVRHSRPRMRRPGQGLAGNKAYPSYTAPANVASSTTTDSSDSANDDISTSVRASSGTSGAIMAMKEIRLELEDAKFAAIIMELDILHRCNSPYIVDFYGAFFQEGAVYICMEFMDGGSIDKLYGDGMPEDVLQKITLATIMGLKSLKDDHNIIHRDVKPTNILVNSHGQVKICDFGVSGNLVASIAKTNIGCQSYMAPERISSGGIAQAGANPGGGTYSVQSDIWSLGLTIIECALGQYPYPPETYDNIFSQLSVSGPVLETDLLSSTSKVLEQRRHIADLRAKAIVDGDPPDLPADRFSEAARDFVRGCLMKIPKLRPTYAMLLQHAWLAPLSMPATIAEEDEEEVAQLEAGHDVPVPDTSIQGLSLIGDKDVGDWVAAALERRRSGKMGSKAKPALHTAPLDAVASPLAAS